MKRTAVNPWPWSLNVGYNQAELVDDISQQLVCAGQTAVDDRGNPQHPGDMRGQMTLALDNLEAVLGGGDMDLTNIIRLGIYTTNVDETMKNFDVIGTRLGAAKASPPMTLLGISQLAIPTLLFEIEATAVK